MKHILVAVRSLLCVCFVSVPLLAQNGKLNIFTTSGDIGGPAIKGSATFSDSEYRITGAGTNIWGKRDQFQCVWREISGNFTAEATLHFLGEGAEHRKAGLMVRQTADPDSAYAGVLIHGTGMPALQWRSKQGEETNTFDLPFDGPGTFKIKMVRNGVKINTYIAKNGTEPQEIAHTEVSFHGPVLVGLVVCSHQADALTTVLFSDVPLDVQPAPPPKAQ